MYYLLFILVFSYANASENDIFGINSGQPLFGKNIRSNQQKTLPADGQAHIYATPDRTLYHAMTGPDGQVQCITVDSEGQYGQASDIIFSETINPSPTTRFIEVHFSSQINFPIVGTTHIYDGLSLVCTATQVDANGVQVTKACSSTKETPFLIGRKQTIHNILMMTSYHGYVEIDSKDPVTIEIQLLTMPWQPSQTGSRVIGQACYNNLILRY